eukprot:2387935-Pyramimonas_sp.AAC.1
MYALPRGAFTEVILGPPSAAMAASRRASWAFSGRRRRPCPSRMHLGAAPAVLEATLTLPEAILEPFDAMPRHAGAAGAPPWRSAGAAPRRRVEGA